MQTSENQGDSEFIIYNKYTFEFFRSNDNIKIDRYSYKIQI